MKKYFTDILFMLSVTLVVVLFAVSAPATFDLVRVFHSDGSDLGVALSIALMLSLELSAIGFKLATLQVPEWKLRLNLLTILFLCMTMIANYVFGANQATMAALNPILRGWFEYQYVRVLAAFMYAATVPVFLYAALSILASRWQTLQGRTASLGGNITTLADKRDLALLETLQIMQQGMQVMLQRVEVNNTTISPPLLASANAQQVTEQPQPAIGNETITADDETIVDEVETEDKPKESKTSRIRKMLTAYQEEGVTPNTKLIATDVGVSQEYVRQVAWKMKQVKGSADEAI